MKTRVRINENNTVQTKTKHIVTRLAFIEELDHSAKAPRPTSNSRTLFEESDCHGAPCLFL